MSADGTPTSSANPLRQRHLGPVHNVVLKLGTQLLADRGKRSLNATYLADVAAQVVALRNRSVRVTLVSSGAIGAGVAQLQLPQRPTDLAKLQAVAAVGQPYLMEAWADAFAPHGLRVAQVLLTREDIDDRTRFLNLRNTLHALNAMGAIPIVNENDTVSTDEIVSIGFGDNDILAALVAHALAADLLVLMSVVDGLLDAAGKPVRLVQSLDDVRQLVRAEKSELGKGGMNSKLVAAKMLTDAGEALVVADGRMPRVLSRLLDGEDVGTLFIPAKPHGKRSSRSRWIGSVRPSGAIVVDAGAARALTQQNRSLLAAGIVRVEGNFSRGDCVAIQGPDGAGIARGLSNYEAAEVERVRGKKTKEIRALLGEAAYDEVVHRDNLVVS
jgi:glutamate 5-kinase